MLAGRFDDEPLAATAVADADVDELAEDAALDAAYFAGAFAGGAALGFGAGLGAQAVTGAAQLGAVDDDALRRAERGFLEAELQTDLQVGATARRATPGLRGGAEEGVEDVAEAAKGPKALETTTTAHLAVEAGVAKAVVGGAALGVGEDLVGFVDLFEARLSSGLAVAVRVELHGEAAKGSLDLVG